MKKKYLIKYMYNNVKIVHIPAIVLKFLLIRKIDFFALYFGLSDIAFFHLLLYRCLEAAQLLNKTVE